MVDFKVGEWAFEVVFEWRVRDESGFGETGRLKRFEQGNDVCGDEAVVEDRVGFFELFHQLQFTPFLVLQVSAVQDVFAAPHLQHLQALHFCQVLQFLLYLHSVLGLEVQRPPVEQYRRTDVH